MCTWQAGASAFADIYSGFAEAGQIKRAADIEAIQYRTQAILAGAEGARQKTGLRQEFDDVMQTNIAAAAISGFDITSFDQIMDGNEEALNKAQAAIGRNVASKQRQLKFQAEMMKAEARMKASAAKFAGIISAASTLDDAEADYQEGHVGEGRMAYAKKSFDNSPLATLFRSMR